MKGDRQRLVDAVNDPDNREDVVRVVAAALRLKRALYSQEQFGPYLFTLRKSLEGIFGHELPELDEYGQERKEHGID